MNHFKLITDYKPFVPLRNNNDLALRNLSRFMRGMESEYTPRKTLVVADALSRSHIDITDSSTEADMNCHVGSVINSLPIPPQDCTVNNAINGAKILMDVNELS